MANYIHYFSQRKKWYGIHARFAKSFSFNNISIRVILHQTMISIITLLSDNDLNVTHQRRQSITCWKSAEKFRWLMNAKNPLDSNFGEIILEFSYHNFSSIIK